MKKQEYKKNKKRKMQSHRSTHRLDERASGHVLNEHLVVRVGRVVRHRRVQLVARLDVLDGRLVVLRGERELVLKLKQNKKIIQLRKILK